MGLRVVATGRALEARKGVAAVGGLVRRRVERIDQVGILWINKDPGVVAALSVANARVGGSHLLPRGAAIIRAEESVVRNEIHALRIRIHGHSNRRAPTEARQAAAGEFFPGHATVERLEHHSGRRAGRAGTAPASALRRHATRRRRRIVMKNSRGVYHIWPVERAREFLHARRIVDVQGLRPRRAAVGAAIHAARVGFGVKITLRGHEQHVRVARIHDDRRNLLGGGEPDALPVLSRIDRLIHAIAFVDHAARHLVARTHVDDIRVRRRDFHRANGRHLFHRVEHRIPHLTGAGGFPNTSRRQSHVVGAWLTDRAGGRRDASATEGADIAPRQAGEKIRLDGCRSGNEERARERERRARESGERTQASQHGEIFRKECGARSAPEP